MKIEAVSSKISKDLENVSKLIKLDGTNNSFKHRKSDEISYMNDKHNNEIIKEFVNESRAKKSLSENDVDDLTKDLEKISLGQSDIKTGAEKKRNFSSELGLVCKGPTGGKDSGYKIKLYNENDLNKLSFNEKGKRPFSDHNDSSGLKYYRNISECELNLSNFDFNDTIESFNHNEFSNVPQENWNYFHHNKVTCVSDTIIRNSNTELQRDWADLLSHSDFLPNDVMDDRVSLHGHYNPDKCRTFSGDEGIALSDTLSPCTDFSPESGFDSPGDSRSPYSPENEMRIHNQQVMYQNFAVTSNLSEAYQKNVNFTNTFGAEFTNYMPTVDSLNSVPPVVLQPNSSSHLEDDIVQEQALLPHCNGSIPSVLLNQKTGNHLDKFFDDHKEKLSLLESIICPEPKDKLQSLLDDLAEFNDINQPVYIDERNFPATEINRSPGKLNNNSNDQLKFNSITMDNPLQQFDDAIASAMPECLNALNNISNIPPFSNSSANFNGLGDQYSQMALTKIIANNGNYHNSSTNPQLLPQLTSVPAKFSTAPTLATLSQCQSNTQQPNAHSLAPTLESINPTLFVSTNHNSQSAITINMPGPQIPFIPQSINQNSNHMTPTAPAVVTRPTTVILTQATPVPYIVSNQLAPSQGQCILVVPNEQKIYTTPKTKKSLPPKPFKKILPKGQSSPEVSKPPQIPVRSTQPLVENKKSSLMRDCLDVNSARKLEVARRCVDKMTIADLNYTDSDRDTYLHVAVCRTDPHLVQAMLERIIQEGMTDLIDAKNSKRQTPLYLAVAANQPVMVRLFVRCGADVNSMTEASLPNGRIEVKAAIHCAAAGCNTYLNTLSELIQSRDINLNLANSEGLTALHCAILEHGRKRGEHHSDCKGVIKLLLKAGADPNVQDKCNGKTPLMYAVQSLDYSIVETFSGCVDIRQMIKMLKTQTFDGSTCARIAAGLTLKDEKDKQNWQKISLFLTSFVQNMSYLNQNSLRLN